MAGLTELVLVNKVALAADGNLGLAKKVIAALTKHRIRELTDTYMTLSLSGAKIAKQLSCSRSKSVFVLLIAFGSDIGASSGGKSVADVERELLNMVCLCICSGGHNLHFLSFFLFVMC